MNTPAHLIFGLAAFSRRGSAPVTGAAIAGALIPDLSLYLLAGWHLFVLGTSAQVVFDQLYLSEAWQAVFRIDNSIVLWGIGLAFALWARSAWASALTGAAILHLLLDMAFHAGDGRAHFWPISTWVFHSPVSYWDSAHYGQIIGPLEILVALGLAAFVLWPRHQSAGMRALITGLAVMEIAPVFVWLMFF